MPAPAAPASQSTDALARLFDRGELFRRSTDAPREARASGASRDEAIAIAKAAWPAIRDTYHQEKAAALPDLAAWAGLEDADLVRIARWLHCSSVSLPLAPKTAGEVAGKLYRMRARGQTPAKVQAFIAQLRVDPALRSPATAASRPGLPTDAPT